MRQLYQSNEPLFVKVHNLSSKIAEVSVRQRGDKINNWNKDVKTENVELNFKWQTCLLLGAVYIAVDNLTFRYWNTPETDLTKTLCRGVREWINCYVSKFLNTYWMAGYMKNMPFSPCPSQLSLCVSTRIFFHFNVAPNGMHFRIVVKRRKRSSKISKH